jgi:hypothetical protein
MADLDAIRDAIRRGDREATDHARQELTADGFTPSEVWDSVLDAQAEVIEDNPNDPRGPSCLILTWIAGRPAHCLVAYPAPRRSRARGVAALAVLITVWRPDERPWEWSADFKTRLPQP